LLELLPEGVNDLAVLQAYEWVRLAGLGNKVGSNKTAFLAPFPVVGDAGSIGFRIGVKVAL